MTTLLVTIEEKRLNKIEHRQTAQSKAMNGDDGVLNRLSTCEAKIDSLVDTILLLSGRIITLENRDK